MALRARRSLIPNASRRWTTASASPRVATSFPKGPSAPRCPAWNRPAVASIACSRLPAPSQPFSLGDVHAAESGLPFVDAGVAAAVLAAQIGDRNAGLVLLQYPDDLLFRKAAAFHALVLVLGRSELQTGLRQGGKVTPAAPSSVLS